MASSEITITFRCDATLRELLTFVEGITRFGAEGVLNNWKNSEGDVLNGELVSYKIDTGGGSVVTMTFEDNDDD